jgi:hypothetical protein
MKTFLRVCAFTTVAGHNYTIETSTDLVHWTPTTTFSGDGNPMTLHFDN